MSESRGSSRCLPIVLILVFILIVGGGNFAISLYRDNKQWDTLGQTTKTLADLEKEVENLKENVGRTPTNRSHSDISLEIEMREMISEVERSLDEKIENLEKKLEEVVEQTRTATVTSSAANSMAIFAACGVGFSILVLIILTVVCHRRRKNSGKL